jgi:hypothetical protein
VEPWRRTIAVLSRRAVALELIQAVERYVEAIAALVLHDRNFQRRLSRGNRLNAPIDPDAVLEMDHVVAQGQGTSGR